MCHIYSRCWVKKITASKMAKGSSGYDFAEAIYLSEVLDGNEGGGMQRMDAKFAEQLQLQDALFSVKEMSPSTSTPVNTRASSSMPKQKPRKSVRKASESSLKYCKICVDGKERPKMFTVSGCSHSFCSDCISTYAKTRLEQNITIIKCPDENCEVILELEACRPRLPKEVINLWEAVNTPASSSMPKLKLRKSARKAGESSLKYCEICVDRKERHQMFTIPGCSHSFCSKCVSRYVKTRLEQNITIVTCPDENCEVILELEACRPQLPKEVINLWEAVNTRPTSLMPKQKPRTSTGKAGESSLTYCEICVDRKERHQMFTISGCSHSFCSDCVSTYAKTKLEQNITIITCPDEHCEVILELEACRPQLSKEVVNLWEAVNTKAISSMPKLKPRRSTRKASESSLKYCGICFDRKERHQTFTISGCSHSFCSNCVSMYVKRRLEQNITIITCPGENCEVILELEACRSRLPKEVINLWEAVNTRASSSMPKQKPRKTARKASESSLKYCEICVDRKKSHQMFKISGCSHSFCSDCVSTYVKTKLEQNITIITCPGESCKVILELEGSKPQLHKEVINLWEDLLCKELLCATGGRLYCPFKDCSALLLNDNPQEVIAETECPVCHRLFCAQCHASWHLGINCEEYQKLNEDERGREDLMVRNLAKENKWRRCPRCHIIVERTEGCLHMTCRCKFEFCYACGSKWTHGHVGCQENS